MRIGLRRFIHDLRTEGGGPRREAAAIAVGTFIGCLPLYGLHLMLCMGVGTVFRLNRLKMYLAAHVSNPLVAPWLLLAEVQAGAFLRRGSFHDLTVQTLETTALSVFLGDLVAGSVAVGGVLAALAAWGTYAVVRRDPDDNRFADLVRRACDRYASTSLTAWEFARAKLRFDPIYRSLVSDGMLIGDGRSARAGTLVDVGCGQGLVLALLSEARADVRAGRWPADSPPIPFDRLVGIEKRRRVAGIASAALTGEADIITADARSVAIDGADVVLLIDVLHMMSRDQQEAVLASALASLSRDGRVIVREANAAGGWRFGMVTMSNRLKALAFGNWRQRFAFRSVAEWEACFARLGLRYETRAMGQGTPFANVLFVVTRAEAATPSTDKTGTRTAGGV